MRALRFKQQRRIIFIGFTARCISNIHTPLRNASGSTQQCNTEEGGTVDSKTTECSTTAENSETKQNARKRTEKTGGTVKSTAEPLRRNEAHTSTNNFQCRTLWPRNRNTAAPSLTSDSSRGENANKREKIGSARRCQMTVLVSAGEEWQESRLQYMDHLDVALNRRPSERYSTNGFPEINAKKAATLQVATGNQRKHVHEQLGWATTEGKTAFITAVLLLRILDLISPPSECRASSSSVAK